jgi:mediator of RNA polymerase II transcription subunit 13, fungi type
VAEIRPCLTLEYDKVLGAIAGEPSTRGHAHTNSGGTNLATPVSTPTPGAENASAAASPSAPGENLLDSGPDSLLIDEVDETWGVLLGTRLRPSPSFDNSCPSLASGLLIKRGNRAEDSGLSSAAKIPCIAVHLIWVGNNVTATAGINISSAAPSPGAVRNYEFLLREVLNMYRGLGTLAKARYLNDHMGDVLPWHILTATRGTTSLDTCFPF